MKGNHVIAAIITLSVFIMFIGAVGLIIDSFSMKEKLIIKESSDHYIVVNRIYNRAFANNCRYELLVYGFEDFNGEPGRRPFSVNGRCDLYSEGDTLILKNINEVL